jgi:hypothetical protein
MKNSLTKMNLRLAEQVIGAHTPNDGSRDAIIVVSRRYIVPELLKENGTSSS